MIITFVFCIIATFTIVFVGTHLVTKGFKANWYQFGVGLSLIVISLIGLNFSADYITSVKEELEPEEEKIEASWGTKQLNIDNLYEELLNQELDFPEIVLSQALLETGHFESFSCRERNNLFGLRKKDGSYMVFPHWTYSVAAYKKYIQKYKETPDDYYKFLENLGYAEDSAYIEKVKQTHKKYVKK